MRTIEMAVYVWRWLLGLLPSRPEPVPMAEPCDRAELFQRLTTLRTRRAAESAQHRQDVDALTRQWQAVQGQADEIQRRISALQREDFGASMAATVQEDKLLLGMEGKTSMSIVLFLQELDSELERLYHKEPTEVPGVERDYVAMKKRPTIQTDGPSIQRRVRALHLARQRAAAMRYELLSIAEMTARIIQLKKSIPEVEQQEITGHRAAVLAAN